MNMQKIEMVKHNSISNGKAAATIISSLFLFIMFSAIALSRVNASELEETPTTVSYGTLSETLNDEIRANIMEQNSNAIVSDQISGKATGKTRDEIQAIQLAEAANQITAENSPMMQSRSISYMPEFSIYNAYTALQDDFDKDGFYQTFSVVFDADIYSYDGHDLSEVYALLYLSHDGGPWIHYYTTDNFIIHGDSDQDEYEVMTTLLEGYHPDHYDILIDLYEVGYGDIVATYSSDDNQSLYALPLESADYDQVYVDTVHIHHGGSLSTVALLILLLLLAGRLSRSLNCRFPIRK